MVDRLTKIENKIDTLSKEIHEFKSELKNLLSDKINLSSSVKESFIVVGISLKYLILLFIYVLIILIEGYLVLNHASFFSNFTEDDWITYYNENIHKQDKNSSIVLASVIDRAFQNDHSNAELAYVLAICSTILNLNHDEIRCKKNIMKQKVKKFLKKINSQTGIRYSDFEDNSYEEKESGNETEDEDDDV
ncbi:hypothetical protein GLOIN_2v1880888 [Rhizophagus irregularis DAOM 181602=DAOM 197198]|nr:hypothetical protein GLOIN_2v1880888 [Rhizophagus irregularis DAOM 181602=DAOM 197198]